MPFITDEIWQRVAPLAGIQGKTIMLQSYPVAALSELDLDAIEEMNWVMTVISAIRTIRSERDIAPSKLLPVWLAEGSAQEKEWWARNHIRYLKPLARAEDITWVAAKAAAPDSAMQLVGNMKVLIPLGSLIDKQAELERLGKEMDKLEKELARAKTKLANPDFVARAPKNVVEQEQGRVQQFEAALVNLRNQRAKVEALPG
jgi:valyl-tRNA synthetase